MRIIVIAFAVLAGLKVWTQDRLYRSVMSDALAQAYRERAQQTCLKDAAKPPKSQPNPWTSPTGADLIIGSPGADVALWDVDNPLWDVRFRHPHLVLTAAGNSKLTCTYDLVAGLATISSR